jgi:hypothetical protein
MLTGGDKCMKNISRILHAACQGLEGIIFLLKKLCISLDVKLIDIVDLHFLICLTKLKKLMKKVLSTFIFLCALSAGVFAQSISGGVKAGLNLANQTYSGGGYTSSPSFRPSLHAGGYLTLMFTKHLGLQPEVLYSGEGAKSGNQSYKMSYINIPILVRFNVNDLLSFHAGPQVGLLTSAKYDYGSGTQDVKDNFKSSNISLAAGATVDLPFGLNFTLRFIQGISDINNTSSSTKVHNYGLQVSAGYKLFGK